MAQLDAARRVTGVLSVHLKLPILTRRRKDAEKCRRFFAIPLHLCASASKLVALQTTSALIPRHPNLYPRNDNDYPTHTEEPRHALDATPEKNVTRAIEQHNPPLAGVLPKTAPSLPPH